MSQSMTEAIRHILHNANRSMTDKEVMTALVNEGYLTEEVFNNIVTIGPIDEWLEMKLKEEKRTKMSSVPQS